MNVIWRLVVKELQQLRQDRRMLPSLVVMPLLQMLALGLAANNDVRDLPLLLVDHDRSAASRALADDLTSTGIFLLAAVTDDEREADARLVDGSARLALVIPRGYGRDVASGRTVEVQLLVDGTDSTSATVGLGHASRILAATGAEILAERLDRAGGRAPARIEVEPRVWYNPDLRSRWFYVPGILALVLMLVTMVLPSIAVVREKETGTLEQLAVTPVAPWQLVVGKLVPFALLGLIDFCLISVLVRVLFGVPLRGSFATLLAFTVLFMLSTLGLGLLVSAIARTTQQAMLASVFGLNVPMIYLSGQIFPIENMPRAIQMVTYAVPLRYYNTAVRGVFLKGSTFASLAPEALALLGMGLAFLALASLRFRKSLD